MMKLVKLYEVPNKTKIWVKSKLSPEGWEELFFDHPDGMYSFCTDKYGNVVHVGMACEVGVKDEDF